MTSAPAACNARMLLANPAWPVNAVANARLAPGATSWTSWSMARPSSVPSVQSGNSWITVTGRQVVTGHISGPPAQAVETVGQHAGGDSGAVHAKRGARHVGAHGLITLACDQSHMGCRIGSPCELEAGQRGEGVDGSNRQNLALMSDNGCQPTSTTFMRACGTLGIPQAFTSGNDPTGNAETERVMHTLEEECLSLTEWSCPFELITALEVWIADDNEHDLHSALGYTPPRQFCGITVGATALSSQLLDPCGVLHGHGSAWARVIPCEGHLTQSKIIRGYISKRMAGVQPRRWLGLATKATDLTP